MEDRLEEFIKTNSKALEVDAPEGHFERFALKIQHEQKASEKRFQRLHNVRKWSAIAAIGIIILTIGGIYLIKEPAVIPEKTDLCDLSQDYKDAQFYYTSSFNQQLDQWNQYVNTGVISQQQNKLLQKQLKEFNTTYSQLQKDLAQTPDDDRVIQAMIEIYQTKLNIITMLLKKLENIKEKKDEKNAVQI